MFCENCGKKNSLDAIYCEHCGKKIEREVEPVIEKKSQQVSSNSKFLIIVLILCSVGFLFFQELKYFNSPENALNSYLKNWKNSNYDGIIDNLGITKNDFVKGSIFQSIYHNQIDELKIDKYQIDDCKKMESDEFLCNVVIDYNNGKKGVAKTFQLELLKQKKFFLFKEWKVGNANIHLLENFHLYLPKGSKAVLEGIDLSSYFVEESDKEGFDTYFIPAIFNGTYHLNMELANGTKLVKEILVSKGDFTYQSSLDDLSDDYKKTLSESALKIITNLYDAVIKNKNFEELDFKIAMDDFKTFYETFKKEVSQNITLTSLKINDMKLMNISGNHLSYKLTYQMSYNYEFDYKNGDATEHHQGNSNDIFYITYQGEDFSEMTQIDSLVTYFSKKF